MLDRTTATGLDKFLFDARWSLAPTVRGLAIESVLSDGDRVMGIRLANRG